MLNSPYRREKKRDGVVKDPQPDTPIAARLLRKRRDKGDLDLDAEARPFTEGLPYQDSPGNQTMETIPPPLPQKDTPPMRFIARLKPLPLSPRATWYSTRSIPTKHQHQPQPPLPQSDRSSIMTIRPTPPPQLPQLTVDPPSPPGQHTPLLHVANASPRSSALLTPPPLPEKGGFMPRARRGKAPEVQDGSPPPPSRGHSPRTSFRSSFFGTPALRMPVPLMSPIRRSVVQHEDGGPAEAGPSSGHMAKAAEAASEPRASGDMPPPAYSA